MQMIAKNKVKQSLLNIFPNFIISQFPISNFLIPNS